MKKALIVIGSLIFLSACGGEDEPTCQECLSSTADWTVCDNEDGTVTKTNNLTNVITIDTASYLATIVFMESLNMECN